MRRDAVSYVYKDYGVNYFADFEIDFAFNINGGTGVGHATLISFSNTIGTLADQATANDSISFLAYQNTGNLEFQLYDFNKNRLLLIRG